MIRPEITARICNTCGVIEQPDDTTWESWFRDGKRVNFCDKECSEKDAASQRCATPRNAPPRNDQDTELGETL